VLERRSKQTLISISSSSILASNWETTTQYGTPKAAIRRVRNRRHLAVAAADTRFGETKVLRGRQKMEACV
jgi:hypothetical protein